MIDDGREQEVKTALAQGLYQVQEQIEENSGPRAKYPGLCGSCKHLQLVVTKYGTTKAKCAEFYRMVMDPTDPIEYCTSYWRRGQHTLQEMIDRARIIGIIGKYHSDKMYL